MKKLLISSLAVLAVAASLVSAQDAAPAAPAEGAAAAETKLVLGVLPSVMQFDKKAFDVKAGSKVSILFTNKACPLQHNLIVLKPGTDAAVGAAADKMITTDAAGALTKCYVPDDAASKAAIIAHSTKLIGAGQNEVITFTAPSEPGAYPYVCTFPGHRFLMKGVMTVTK